MEQPRWEYRNLQQELNRHGSLKANLKTSTMASLVAPVQREGRLRRQSTNQRLRDLTDR